MRRPSRSLVASLFAIAALGASTARAAVVQLHRVTVDVDAHGVVHERVSWQVRIDGAKDLERWSPFPIPLDENRKLVNLEASAQPPQGKPIEVDRKRRDRTGVTGESILHASQEAELVDFAGAPDGSVLRLDYEIEERPWFPSGLLELGGEDPVVALDVEVHAPGLRARLTEKPDGLVMEQSADRVHVRGGLPSLPALEGATELRGPVLRWAWAGTPAGVATPAGSDWRAIGAWYRDLVGSVPQRQPAVTQLAEQLTAGTSGKRQAIEKLVAFVRDQVRYVAVEVGIGGFRPSAPADTLARRWGDCKDKALLLVDLLAAAGVDARLALVRGSTAGMVDPDFAAPDEFNHVIVAVPANALEVPAGAPVAGGRLFVDATQIGGGDVGWLSPFVAGQRALLVDPQGGELVTLPLLPQAERQSLVVDVAVASDGAASGGVTLELHGEDAFRLAHARGGERNAAVLAAGRQRLAELLPAALLDDVKVWTSEQGPPTARVTSVLRLPGVFGGTTAEPALLLPGATAMPALRLLDDRKEPLVLRPAAIDAEWTLKLPWASCALDGDAASPPKVDGPLGSFAQQASLSAGTLRVVRHAELRARVAATSELPALTELTAAEHRALLRRVRLRCAG